MDIFEYAIQSGMVDMEKYNSFPSKTEKYRKIYKALPPSPDGFEYGYNNCIRPETAIAAIKLGRKLSKYETPYFKDHDKGNLDPNNVIVMHRNEVRQLGQYAGSYGRGEGIDDRFKIIIDEDGVHAHLEDKETSVYSSLICSNCGQSFKPNNIQILNYQNGLPVYCSKSCRAQSTRKEGCMANGNIREHRFIAQEEILHRPLKPEEIVHHIDGIPSNNNAENLMVLDNSRSHANLHGYDRTDLSIKKVNNEEVYNVTPLKRIVEVQRPEYIRICKNCGKQFYIIHQDSQQQFCSILCQTRYVSKMGGAK